MAIGKGYYAMTCNESSSASRAALDEKIEAILDESDRMFIATSVDGISSGASVFFARDGHDLLFFTFNPSRKAEQIRMNPNVQAVIWPKAQEGIRGLQIDGRCHVVRDPGEQRAAHDKILTITDAFRSYMDDPFLIDKDYRPTVTDLLYYFFNCRDRHRYKWRNRLTYLPIRSVSILTLSPTLHPRKLVCSKVNGMIVKVKRSFIHSLTVRLIPSTATEPLETSSWEREAET